MGFYGNHLNHRRIIRPLHRIFQICWNFSTRRFKSFGRVLEFPFPRFKIDK